ncbi:hypothetical protein DY000_02046680 [Brassica cretica]|uniref:Cyclin N-terminal domain-containing protein n=1 Tax=Brassica cretica TaxID=69181 RepID=A0ABQ7F1L2_BRACR|nr:hypothetical protein DY000_02046680 [Brassica cretica]
MLDEPNTNIKNVDDHVHKQLWLLGRFFSTGSSAKKSLAKFDVKIVAASCVWLASKLEENPKRQDGSSLCSTGWSVAGRSTFTYRSS